MPFTLLVILVTIYFVDVPPLWRWLERRGNTTESKGSVRKGTGKSRTALLASVAREIREVDMQDGSSAVDGWEGKNGDAASDTSEEDV